ncbi:CBASS cGAMP synthase [Persicitalea sp.]|uniref:CBASS cGAMP synthase n=1 Tax=Persicitalea sp. TaxID=3100273 RepID=UPI0035935425
MADCHSLFNDFDNKIALTSARTKSLKKSRKSIRDRIRRYYREKQSGSILPKFWSQGSFEMGTSVNPIPRKITVDGEEKSLYKYDVDDGVYFIDDEANRVSAQTYHNQIYAAVTGYTDEDPTDKDTCVRVVFHDGHNIDLPIYFKDKSDSDALPELAHKSEQWPYSDPRAFVKWFNKHAKENPQLYKLVRYAKAWCDNQNYLAGARKMPSGLVLTIWFTENARYSNDRDDIALRDTLKAVRNSIDAEFSCLRPTELKDENLLEKYSHEEYFKKKLDDFLESAEQAISESNQKEACAKWQRHLGSRFPCHLAEDRDEGARSFPVPAIVKSNAKGA